MRGALQNQSFISGSSVTPLSNDFDLVRSKELVSSLVGAISQISGNNQLSVFLPAHKNIKAFVFPPKTLVFQDISSDLATAEGRQTRFSVLSLALLSSSPATGGLGIGLSTFVSLVSALDQTTTIPLTKAASILYGNPPSPSCGIP